MVNGSNRCNGRVEVFHDGHWKRVCRSDWETQEANIVCQEINCGSPVIQPVTPFLGEARNLDAVKPNCIGNETSISQCRLQEIKASCEDATIFCASKLSMFAHIHLLLLPNGLWGLGVTPWRDLLHS